MEGSASDIGVCHDAGASDQPLKVYEGETPHTDGKNPPVHVSWLL